MKNSSIAAAYASGPKTLKNLTREQKERFYKEMLSSEGNATHALEMTGVNKSQAKWLADNMDVLQAEVEQFAEERAVKAEGRVAEAKLENEARNAVLVAPKVEPTGIDALDEGLAHFPDFWDDAPAEAAPPAAWTVPADRVDYFLQDAARLMPSKLCEIYGASLSDIEREIERLEGR